MTKYNIDDPSSDIRSEVKWYLEIDGKREELPHKGEKVELTVKEEWIGKEIKVTAYI